MPSSYELDYYYNLRQWAVERATSTCGSTRACGKALVGCRVFRDAAGNCLCITILTIQAYLYIYHILT